MQKLYQERDIEALGQRYVDHISAMTGEKLHSKSAIAAELAYRDARIAELEEANKKLLSAWSVQERLDSMGVDATIEWLCECDEQGMPLDDEDGDE